MPEPMRFVVTGGPGAGKSTLLAALAARGHTTFAEAGRAILRLSDAVGSPAHAARSPRAYSEAMLLWDMRSWSEAGNGPAFFDRGVPDTIGYLRLIGHSVPPHMERAARAFRYSDPVFLAPPWRAIYATDSERRHAWDVAVATCACIRAVYEELGYRIVELPLSGIDERVGFVLGRAGAAGSPAR